MKGAAALEESHASRDAEAGGAATGAAAPTVSAPLPPLLMLFDDIRGAALAVIREPSDNSTAASLQRKIAHASCRMCPTLASAAGDRSEGGPAPTPTPPMLRLLRLRSRGAAGESAAAPPPSSSDPLSRLQLLLRAPAASDARSLRLLVRRPSSTALAAAAAASAEEEEVLLKSTPAVRGRGKETWRAKADGGAAKAGAGKVSACFAAWSARLLLLLSLLPLLASGAVCIFFFF